MIGWIVTAVVLIAIWRIAVYVDYRILYSDLTGSVDSQNVITTFDDFVALHTLAPHDFDIDADRRCVKYKHGEAFYELYFPRRKDWCNVKKYFAELTKKDVEHSHLRNGLALVQNVKNSIRESVEDRLDEKTKDNQREDSPRFQSRGIGPVYKCSCGAMLSPTETFYMAGLRKYCCHRCGDTTFVPILS